MMRRYARLRGADLPHIKSTLGRLCSGDGARAQHSPSRGRPCPAGSRADARPTGAGRGRTNHLLDSRLVADQRCPSTVGAASAGALGNAWLRDAEAELEQSQQRLQAVQGRAAELQTLEKQREKIEQERLRLENRLAKNTLRAPAAGTVLTGQLEQRVEIVSKRGKRCLKWRRPRGGRRELWSRKPTCPRLRLGSRRGCM